MLWFVSYLFIRIYIINFESRCLIRRGSSNGDPTWFAVVSHACSQGIEVHSERWWLTFVQTTTDPCTNTRWGSRFGQRDVRRWHRFRWWCGDAATTAGFPGNFFTSQSLFCCSQAGPICRCSMQFGHHPWLWFYVDGKQGRMSEHHQKEEAKICSGITTLHDVLTIAGLV